MTDAKNTQIFLKKRPPQIPEPQHFGIREVDMPAPQAGEALCKIHYLSLDPYMRGQISGRHITGTVHEGDTLLGQTIGEVIDSKHDDYKVGDMLCFHGGWQAYALCNGTQTSRVDPRIQPASLALGILGMPGLTAYAGLLDLGEPKKDDVLVVSAATGGVGSMVGQIGRIHGCRVIGIAGSAEKCQWAVEQAGFAACIDYHKENVAERLDALCPDGVHIYFDNVGGDILEAVIWRLAVGARVVLCGLMAQYNDAKLPPGPNPGAIIKARATVRGLVVYDHVHRQADFVSDVLDWLADGSIAYKEDIAEGLAQAPESFCRLMRGNNFGKTIIKL